VYKAVYLPEAIDKILKRVGIEMKNRVIWGISLFLILVTVLFPLPAQLMDLLIVATIGISVMVLLLALFIKTTSRSWLPSILTLFTIFKVMLSVSVIRLILISGYAGEVIGTFGNFLGAGNLIIGLIILGVVTAFSFAIIIKSEKRVHEITASHTTDTNNSHDNADTFYKAMDGVIKFAKGNAILTAMALVIIVIGGVIVRDDAISVFMLLAIGYGVVFLLPTLLVVFTSGLITSRVHENTPV